MLNQVMDFAGEVLPGSCGAASSRALASVLVAKSKTSEAATTKTSARTIPPIQARMRAARLIYIRAFSTLALRAGTPNSLRQTSASTATPSRIC
jgi:hypothetical protein